MTFCTQNVDGLHQRAGSGGTALIELHGNIQRTKCFDNGHPIDRWEDTHIPPRCNICGSNMRPDVVWFGESLPSEALNSAFKAADNSEVFLSIGTSTVVEPAASLPFIALRSGAVVVEINPVETPLTPSANYVLRGKSGEILPMFMQSVWGI